MCQDDDEEGENFEDDMDKVSGDEGEDAEEEAEAGKKRKVTLPSNGAFLLTTIL